MDRTIELKQNGKDDYRFLETDGDHIHQLFRENDWKNLIGVSSVVKDITNFGIAAYYGSRRCLMGLGYDPKDAKNDPSGFKTLISDLSTKEDKDIVKTLYNAYTAHAKYAKSRAEKGTSSHDIVDKWIKRCIAENNGNIIADENPVVKKFIELTGHLKPRFVASEKHGYNEELWLGGITDVIVETVEGLEIWDNKDRPAIYDKDLLQMGGYSLLFPMKFTGVRGIPLEGKEVRGYFDIGKLQNAFKCQLEVYKFLEAFNQK